LPPAASSRPVIPPSIGFILFGVIGGVSISKLFLAGIFPGILMGLALIGDLVDGWPATTTSNPPPRCQHGTRWVTR
jgi:TRAP-type mannitol/chloroaromatic compound transport system permease large subunit